MAECQTWGFGDLNRLLNNRTKWIGVANHFWQVEQHWWGQTSVPSTTVAAPRRAYGFSIDAQPSLDLPSLFILSVRHISLWMSSPCRSLPFCPTKVIQMFIFKSGCHYTAWLIRRTPHLKYNQGHIERRPASQPAIKFFFYRIRFHHYFPLFNLEYASLFPSSSFSSSSASFAW